MEIQTIEYNTNQPVNQQITVPINSIYGIGIKVSKDGEALSCGMDELTINGISATTQSNDYNIYVLSSDGAKTLIKYSVCYSHDGFETSFPLQVLQQDMGYFER